jgi:hypothetical protein
VRRAPSTLERHLTDGVLVLGPAPAEPLALTGTAGVLWDALADPWTTEALVAEMQRRFRGDPERIRRDVRATVDELVRAGVLDR